MSAKLYINGKCVEGKGKPIDVINPATGKVIGSFKAASVEQAEEALQAAKSAFKVWSFSSINERIAWMKKLRDAISAEKESLIDLMLQEGGKNIAEAESDFNLPLTYLDFFAEEAKRVYDVGVTDYNDHRKHRHTIIRRPLGVVVGHLAWNMPVTELGQKMYPAMASGCTCVLKPSTATPLASLKIGEICEKIGLPAGVVNILTGPADEIGGYLTSSTIPAMITVVGSSNVGIRTMRDGATGIKHYSMELGGNAPAIILPDCDLDRVATWVARRKVTNAGQGCANVNRIFVHESLHDEFMNKLLAEVKQITVGWGKDMPDAMGALIDIKTRDRMLAMVQESVAAGAKLVYGGVIPDNLPDELKGGAFMIPAVLDGVTDAMPIAKQEIFGPIYTVFTS
jgi:succinate-semialdehyde dehydrogenase/glutarate-semialdehyde dehydrogenase